MKQLITRPSSASESSPVWDSLKQAIINSSGFKRWLQEARDWATTDPDLDTQVAAYLRQTLETLAY